MIWIVMIWSWRPSLRFTHRASAHTLHTHVVDGAEREREREPSNGWQILIGHVPRARRASKCQTTPQPVPAVANNTTQTVNMRMCFWYWVRDCQARMLSLKQFKHHIVVSECQSHRTHNFPGDRNHVATLLSSHRTSARAWVWRPIICFDYLTGGQRPICNAALVQCTAVQHISMRCAANSNVDTGMKPQFTLLRHGGDGGDNCITLVFAVSRAHTSSAQNGMINVTRSNPKNPIARYG